MNHAWRRPFMFFLMGLILGVSGCMSAGRLLPISEYHTDIVALWDANSNSLLQSLHDQPGQQSRDLGPKIRKLAATGALTALPGCFDFAVTYLVHRLPFGATRVKIWVNEEEQEYELRLGMLEVPVKVCNGLGFIRYATTIIRQEASLAIRAPWSGLPYPRLGVLKSCAQAEILHNAPWCGKVTGDPSVSYGELYFLAHTTKRAWWHFAR
ncbi:MAG: hypothetical protein A2945_05230 [Candidatus Liptonbacteria bacterium RIFCSPLOWO2_01_FULL_52_25]|uniref:Uncharacterized protein n=2 Tax=Parcubacteria group TaxID=1794811 RepID=A0A1G2CG78_9BACT|nr:MAG: hypothetical protein A2945_05230 [Candidatus Liptonbacteria bacterium RIFCSPLOWO2_01_FULL_52_25]